jgi:hypothetical protein
MIATEENWVNRLTDGSNQAHDHINRTVVLTQFFFGFKTIPRIPQDLERPINQPQAAPLQSRRNFLQSGQPAHSSRTSYHRGTHDCRVTLAI